VLQTLCYPILTKDDAPEASRDALQRIARAVGGIPNLAAVMAHSPSLIEGFVTLREIIRRNADFTPLERELIFLANASANGCEYCQAVHATFAAGAGVAPETIEIKGPMPALAFSNVR